MWDMYYLKSVSYIISRVSSQEGEPKSKKLKGKYKHVACSSNNSRSATILDSNVDDEAKVNRNTVVKIIDNNIIMHS